jgi:NADH-quinone oxidoreductase subunit F
MAFETLKAVGSELGTGAIIVMDENTCMVQAARRLSKFFAHESCGQCTPCRLGSTRLYEILDRIERGKGWKEDLDLLLETAQGIDGITFCPMGAALVNPARSALKHFHSEFEYHITNKHCPVNGKPA